jgi:hypothetical protein
VHPATTTCRLLWRPSHSSGHRVELWKAQSRNSYDHKADTGSFDIDRDLRIWEITKKTIFFEVTCSKSDAPARVAVLDLENEGGFQKLISQDSSSALRSDHSVLRSGATLASAEPSALAAPSTRP